MVGGLGMALGLALCFGGGWIRYRLYVLGLRFDDLAGRFSLWAGIIYVSWWFVG